MPKAPKEKVDQVREDLEYVAGINVDEVVARPELGAINFATTRDFFEEAKRIALECRNFPLDVGTEDTLNEIVNPLEPLKAAIEDVAAFTLSGTANPEDERDQRSLAMQNALDQFENVVFNVRPRYAVVASDFREPLRQASEIIAGARTEAAAELENVKGFAVEAKEVLGTVREAAKREGVQNFAPLFEDLAEENGKESITWLWWAAGLGAATTIAAFVLLIFFPVTGSASDGTTLSSLLARIVIISIMYYATIWTARNYRALRHQRTVNQHRHKALMTFETFVQGGEHSETRDAVLREATRCIFSPAATGYLGKHDDMPQSSVVEVMQSAARGATE